MNASAAKVILTLDEFRAIATTTADPRWCPVKSLKVEPDPAGKVSQSGMLIVVRGRGAVDIEITVFDKSGGESFTPLGICYDQSAGAGDRRGTRNFRVKEMTPEVLTITDRFVDPSPEGARLRWKFFLVIQNAGGEIGIIDPEIQNED